MRQINTAYQNEAPFHFIIDQRLKQLYDSFGIELINYFESGFTNNEFLARHMTNLE